MHHLPSISGTFRLNVETELVGLEGFAKAEGVEGAESKATRARFRGVVSTEHVDKDGDVILQDGIDWSLFKASGIITYGHPANGLNTIGEPVSLERTMVKGVPATVLAWDCYLTDRLGFAVYDKARALQKAGASRQFGLSVEGGIIDRDPEDESRVTRSIVSSVAVDPRARNGETTNELEALQKAMAAADPLASLLHKGDFGAAGYPSQGTPVQGMEIAALVPQSIQGAKDGPSAGHPYGLSDFDLAVAALLKRADGRGFPLHWSQGVSACEKLAG